mgnify:FL=1
MFEKSLKKSHFTLFLYKQNVSYISDVKIRNATFFGDFQTMCIIVWNSARNFVYR